MKEKTEKTFEDALARLEQVVRELEGGKTPLDQTLSLFEEGKALVTHCEKALTKAEQKVMKVTESGDLIRVES